MRGTKPIDLSNLAEFPGQWVALTPDGKKVVGASADLNKALKQAKVKGVFRPYVVKSPGYEMAGFFH